MPHEVLGARKYIPILLVVCGRARGAHNTLFASEYRPGIDLRLELRTQHRRELLIFARAIAFFSRE
jgi:hypothetical protein